MLSRKAIILKKAEYLLGRKLTKKEMQYLLDNYEGDGTRADLTQYVSSFTQKKIGSFKTVWEVLEPRLFNADKLSRDELLDIVQDLVVRATSVEAGMKILRNALKKDRKGLMIYLFNLYLRDAHQKQAASSSPPIALEDRPGRGANPLADPWSQQAIGNFSSPAAPTSDPELLYTYTGQQSPTEKAKYLDVEKPGQPPRINNKRTRKRKKKTYL